MRELAEIRFPYREFRKGQKELADEIEKSVRSNKLLIINAPTGFGKTSAVIYGLLKAKAEKVLYVVRTVNEIDPVIRELKGFGAKFTFLFSARRSCPLFSSKGTDLTPEEFWENCRLTRIKGLCTFYLNLESINEQETWNYVKDHYSFHAVKVARDIAKHLKVCPFFALRSLIGDSTFIVAVYPYLFRKDIFTYFLEPYSYEDLVVVVDEAHSLLDAQSLVERTITPSVLRLSINDIKTHSPEAKELLNTLEKTLGTVSRLRPPTRIRIVDKKIFEPLINMEDQIIDVTEDIRRKKFEQALTGGSKPTAVSTPLYRLVLWINIASMESSKIFLEPGSEEVRIKATPVDPSVIVSDPLEKARSVILMSGTMPPGEFVEEVLNVKRERTYVDVEMQFGPFIPRDNIYTVVALNVTTKYKERSGMMFRRISEYLALMARELPGPKLAVYPSYDIMKEIVSKLPVDIPLIVEGRGTSLEEAKLKVEENLDVIVNAVAGGKLAEGVEFTDYEGSNLLHTVIIVGVPYPQPDDYTKEQLDTLASRIGKSRARYYTYEVKAFVRVRQALGRAIRSPRDKVIYLLLDKRFINKKLRGLIKLPINRLVSSISELSELIDKMRSFIS